MKRFVEGSKAEALDEEGVWCVCTVVCTESEAISVAFDGWGEEWNRTIDDPREIRERSIIPESSGRVSLDLFRFQVDTQEDTLVSAHDLSPCNKSWGQSPSM